MLCYEGIWFYGALLHSFMILKKENSKGIFYFRIWIWFLYSYSTKKKSVILSHLFLLNSMDCKKWNHIGIYKSILKFLYNFSITHLFSFFLLPWWLKSNLKIGDVGCLPSKQEQEQEQEFSRVISFWNKLFSKQLCCKFSYNFLHFWWLK